MVGHADPELQKRHKNRNILAMPLRRLNGNQRCQREAVIHPLASAAVFLCSSASDYVHGHVLVVDGGWLAR